MARPMKIPSGVSDKAKARIAVQMLRPYLLAGDLATARLIIERMIRNERGFIRKQCARNCDSCRAAYWDAETGQKILEDRVKAVKRAARRVGRGPLPPEDTSGGF